MTDFYNAAADALADDDWAVLAEEDFEHLSGALTDTDLEAGPSSKHVLIMSRGRYKAYAVDLEYLWRWEIYLDADRLVQSGGAISLNSATEAVGHVLAYFSARDANTICGTAGESGRRSSGPPRTES